ncbi:MAG: hypothetical protein HQ559_01140 [Lentisphaerae bacterium]|nr:hypothetical protein [Lentisphaerota bacterium]
MRTRIWNNMSNIKFKAVYTGECSGRADLIGRTYSFFLSFASASSVAAWAFWESVPGLWASIVATAQALHLAKPYVPFMKHDKDFLEMSFEFEHLYLEYERFWVAYDDDRIPEEEAETKFYELREKGIEIEERHKQARCPRFKQLMAMADRDVKTALALNFT